ncbi:MAG: GNAT family N-acetyltransferase [Actinomycetota bacterium]|nr:GNAT family N-acetyltransferase [Actinomycetota bacterium]
MAWSVRPATAEEIPELVRADWAAFGNRPSDAEIEEARRFLELDRSLVAVEGDRIVGTAGTLTLELTVPGPATVPAAGVTYVGVLPTHRRQGILTALMAGLYEDAARRQEPMAALLASEATIYRRFGYGVAVSSTSVEIERSRAALRRPVDLAGHVRMLDPGELPEVLPPIHDRYRRLRPGEVSRPPAWWARRLADRDEDRHGAGARFTVVWNDAADGGEPTGYVTYRVRQRREEGMPGGTLEIEDLITLTDQARAGLWQYCFGVDLIAVVRAWGVPVDEPLPWMLVDRRRLRVTANKDFLWLRLLDVEASLAARGYGCDSTLVLEVGSAGERARYRLTGGSAGEAVCRRTHQPADLALDIADLAAAYLGGVRFSTLARAGLVAELTPGALFRADALFSTTTAPFCCTGF